MEKIYFFFFLCFCACGYTMSLDASTGIKLQRPILFALFLKLIPQIKRKIEKKLSQSLRKGKAAETMDRI